MDNLIAALAGASLTAIVGFVSQLIIGGSLRADIEIYRWLNDKKGNSFEYSDRYINRYRLRIKKKLDSQERKERMMVVVSAIVTAFAFIGIGFFIGLTLVLAIICGSGTESFRDAITPLYYSIFGMINGIVIFFLLRLIVRRRFWS